MNKGVKWYEAYDVLASLLVEFYEKNGENSSVALYKLLAEDEEFKAENNWFFDGKSQLFNLKKIDPIHVFASFNMNKIKLINRTKRLDLFVKIISDYFKKETIPQYHKRVEDELKKINKEKTTYSYREHSLKDILDYDGCPSPQLGNILKPRRTGKNEFNKEEDVWDLFYKIKKSSDIDAKTDHFGLLNNALELNSVGFTFLSIFLFWTDYKYFPPLDKNTVTHLKKRRRLVIEPTRFDDNFSDILRYKGNNPAKKGYVTATDGAIIYPQLASLSWSYTERPDTQKINLTDANTKKTAKEQLLIDYGLKQRTADYNGFQIIGLKVNKKDKTNSHLIKSLAENKIYHFYNAYTINKDGKTIKYDSSKNTGIYHIKKEKDFTTVNISAIVGKNGTGKSTLTELIFIAIYNLYCKFAPKNETNEGRTMKFKFVRDLNIELYLKTTYIYKITFGEGDSITIEKYDKYGNYQDEKNSENNRFGYSELVKIYDSIWHTKKRELKELEEDKLKELYLQEIKDEFPCNKKTYTDKIYQKYENLINENKSEIKAIDFAQFFTLNVNYSIYGLNTKHDRQGWLKAINQNESYDFPIILNPHKVDGNIDINNEEEVLKQRLIVNLLRKEEEEEDNDGYDFLQITEYQRASKLQLKKLNYIKDEEFEQLKLTVPSIDVHDELIDTLKESEFKNSTKHLYRLQNIGDSYTDEKSSVFRLAKRYIVFEACRIVHVYNQYFTFKDAFNETIDEQTRIKKQLALFNRIYNNSNYFTHNVRQAIYFMKFYDSFKAIYEKSIEFDIKELSITIDSLIHGKSKHKLQDLIPPPFFDIDITLEVNKTSKQSKINQGNKVSTLDQLSSGEKQKIYSISSIFYHIQNVDSINSSSSAQTVTYRDMNIIFDEIELYFHPELQRTYIYDLLRALKKLNLQYLSGINIIFITHSPFILSDIPKDNICFLQRDNNEEKSFEHTQTFAANIHDLLSNGFFMNSTIGEFAASKIKEIIDFYEEVVKDAEKEIDKAELKAEYLKQKADFKMIYNIIGEEYIKSIVGNHLADIENTLLDDKEKYFETNADKIRRLERKIQELEVKSLENKTDK